MIKSIIYKLLSDKPESEKTEEMSNPVDIGGGGDGAVLVAAADKETADISDNSDDFEVIKESELSD